MQRVVVAEERATDSGFEASLIINGCDALPIAITNPFQHKQECELQWYFNDWMRHPFEDETVPQRAARSIKHYGMWLFNQLFPYGRARGEYALLRDKGSRTQIEIVGKSPEFHAIHWEALQDPDLPKPLAVDWQMVRKTTRGPASLAEIQPATFINLLVVTARPRGGTDLGANIISRPLTEAVSAAQMGVHLEVLRPGSFEALSERLESRGPGHFHIVHFDCPWAEMDHAGVCAKGHVLKGRAGKLDAASQGFEGSRAFMCLEGANEMEIVETTVLGDLLVRMQVPSCILHARQLGEAADCQGDCWPAIHVDPLASVGAELLAAGVHVIVTMSYAMTASATRMYLETLYRQLVLQQPVLEALRLGRLELYSHKERRVYHNASLDLEDWLVPEVYASQSEDLVLCGPGSARGREAPLDRRAPRFVEPTCGFVGRELEVWRIENALQRHNVLVVEAPGGTGKTTLLAYLCEWWQTTRFVADAFYFAYDVQAWTLWQIMTEIMRAIHGESEQAEFEELEAEAQVEMVVSTLKADDYVLVLDSFESVTGEGLTAGALLPPQEQDRIAAFLAALVGGRTKVVLGSRNREDWLTGSVRKNVVRLKGLDREARSVLAQKILERHVADDEKIARLRRDGDFQRLNEVLAGYPLAMVVVLANLAHQTPRAILEGLNANNVLKGTRLEALTLSILCCVDYSYRVTSLRTQQMLVCLAPFERFFALNTLDLYVEELEKQPAFQGVDLSGMDDAVKDAVRWGLLSPSNPDGDDGQIAGLIVLPGFPFFLKAKLNQQDEAKRQALRKGFKNHYKNLGVRYESMMASKDKAEVRRGLQICQLEAENLNRALKMCIEDKEPPAMFDCLQEYYLQRKEFAAGLEVAKYVHEGREPCPYEKPKGDAILNLLNVEDWIGRWRMELGEHKAAKEVYLQMQSRIQGMEVQYEEKKELLVAVHHNLGKVNQELKQYREARQSYEDALKIDIEYEDLHSQARTYHNLGIIAEAMRDFVAARHNDKQALSLFIKLNDRHSQARVYGQLGNVCKELRDYARGYKNYSQALDLFVELRDARFQATTHHQLGVVAGHLGELDKARQHYERALEMFSDFGDVPGQAKACAQLGNVAGELREFDKAKELFQRALKLFVQCGDLQSQEKTYHSLGMVAQHLHNYDEARDHYQLAFDVISGLEDRQPQARTLRRLGDVAYELREYGESRWSYENAMQVAIEFDDRYEQGNIHCALGKLDRTTEDYRGAKEHLQKGLAIFEEFHDERMAGIATRWLKDLSNLGPPHPWEGPGVRPPPQPLLEGDRRHSSWVMWPVKMIVKCIGK